MHVLYIIYYGIETMVATLATFLYTTNSATKLVRIMHELF